MSQARANAERRAGRTNALERGAVHFGSRTAWGFLPSAAGTPSKRKIHVVFDRMHCLAKARDFAHFQLNVGIKHVV